MTNLLQASRSVAAYDDALHSFAGNQYWSMPISNWKPDEEVITADFVGLVSGAYKRNAVVFACELTRMALFSEARFQWRRELTLDPPEKLKTAAEAKLVSGLPAVLDCQTRFVPHPAMPAFGSQAPKTTRSIRARTIAPVHMAQGSSVTYNEQPSRRHEPS